MVGQPVLSFGLGGQMSEPTQNWIRAMLPDGSKPSTAHAAERATPQKVEEAVEFEGLG